MADTRAVPTWSPKREIYEPSPVAQLERAFLAAFRARTGMAARSFPALAEEAAAGDVEAVSRWFRLWVQRECTVRNIELIPGKGKKRAHQVAYAALAARLKEETGRGSDPSSGP